MIAFGPVPSRRLGRSLGINHIPPKLCPYSCVYCQLGRTVRLQVDRQEFHAPEHVAQSVRQQLDRIRDAGEKVNYLTFVPDGEPTLDLRLGPTIDALKPFGIPLAVITNAALIDREDVRRDLGKADWVSLKVDATQPHVWRRIDRPHGALRLASILDGAVRFAAEFAGVLTTETLLVEGTNDDESSLREVARFLARLHPAVAYLSVPIRPPAEPWVRAPAEPSVNRAYQILREHLDRVENLMNDEGNAFACTGQVQEDLLSITSVHPMRREAVHDFLKRAGADWNIVEELVSRRELVETEFGGRRFYLRKLQRPPPQNT